MILGCVAASTALATEPLPDARQLYDGRVMPDQLVQRLAHSDELFPVRTVERSTHPRPLPLAPERLPELAIASGGKHYDLYDYLALNRVAGLLILKNGRVVREDYLLGIGAQTRWSSFSMAKSVTSTLIGAALQQGRIASLDDPVTRYLPQLRGGAYEGVTVRQVLQMASGVAWDETYTDPASDRRRLLDLQLRLQPGTNLKFMSALGRAAPPGTRWNYSTGETFVAGAILEAAVGKPLATYLAETIWQPWGMESDAHWWLESPDGAGWGGSGLAATLRDFGRFGEFVRADGIVDNRRVLPPGWFDEAGRAHTIGGQPVNYGYLWWTPLAAEPAHAGAFEAIGIFGQYLYVNPREQLVIVVLSARSKPSGMNIIDDEAFFAAVVRALHSGHAAR